MKMQRPNLVWWSYYLEAKAKSFMRFKKTVTEGLVDPFSTASSPTPRGIIEDSFKLTLEKFKNQASKDLVARHQVNYLRQNLCKPM